MDKELVWQYKLVLVKKGTLVPIEVVDGQSLSSRLVTHETKASNVTIGSHISKVVFNVISSPRNLVIIGLCWFVLHNPPLDWHMRSLHFETPQLEALECETYVRNMWNMKHNEDLGGIRKPKCPKHMFVGTKTSWRLWPLLQIMTFSTRNFDQKVPLLDTSKNHLSCFGQVVFDMIGLTSGLFD
jgi:hypothetical protein